MGGKVLRCLESNDESPSVPYRLSIILFSTMPHLIPEVLKNRTEG
jgi:hypothetical protein